MLKKKKFYIIVMIISSLLLCGDMIFYFAAKPAASSVSSMPDFSSFSGTEMQEMPSQGSHSDSSNVPSQDSSEIEEKPQMSEGTEMEELPQMSEGTEMQGMPSGGDSSSMPSMPSQGSDSSSSDSGSMPQMPSQGGSNGSRSSDSGSMPQMPSQGGSSGSSSSDSGSMPQMPSQGGSSMPDMSNFSTDGSFPSNADFSGQTAVQQNPLRKACIPLAILFLLIDFICAVRLILLKKKEKKNPADPEAEEKALLEAKAAEEAEYAGLSEREKEDLIAKKEMEESILLRKGKHRRNAVIAILLIVILVLVILLTNFLSAKNISVTSSVEEKVYENSVEKGSIETDVIGGGSLTAGEASSVTIPGTVTVTRFAVSNGDHVEEGDLIAEVDKTTVLSSIAELQTLMNELDSELEASASDEMPDEITASAAGRVVAVYAEAGTKLSDTMYDHNALLVISLDGLLSISFETENEYSIGDSMTITESDGTEYTGKVASIDQSSVTVTVSDDGPLPADQVTVTDKEGNEVTTGSLSVHSEQDVVGFTGTTETVKVKVGDTVESGDTLLTLDDTAYEANYDTLLEERQTMEDQMTVLIKAYMTGGIYAESNGIITDIDEDAIEVSCGINASAWYGAEASEQTVSRMDSNSDSKNAEDGKSSEEESGSATASSESVRNPDGSSAGGSGSAGSSDSSSGGNASAGSGSSSDPSVSEEEESDVDLDAIAEILNSLTTLSDSQLNTLLEKLNNDTIQVLFKMYTQAQAKEEGSADSGSGSESGGQTTDFPGGNDNGEGTGGNTAGGSSAGGNTAGGNSFDISGIISGGSSSGSVSMSDISSLMGGSGSGSISASDYAASVSASSDSAESSTEFVYEEEEIAVLTPDDTVTIDITVDEQDILLIAEGQTAEITLDAIPGTSFTGTVDSIDKEGNNSGGNTKYTVTILMDREEDMLSGMNAHVTIPISTKEDVLTIPAEALQEDGSSIFVYTGYNEADDELTDPVEVTTGKSDGVNVEITGGLEEGDTYYYRYGDTIQINFGNE